MAETGRAEASTAATLRVGVAQMNSWADIDTNLAHIRQTVEAMATDGVRLACFPENAPLLAPDRERLAAVEPLDGRQIDAVRGLAAKHGVGVLLGSFAEAGPDAEHSFNTSVLVDASGEIAGVYRKIHLFDVEVGPDTSFRESATVAPGPAEPVVVGFEGWGVGLSVCYDLRFPELYRALSAGGAEILAIPAAFTFRTGAAHWDILLRARAIENLCYVVAPAQVGAHYGRRESFGHAMVVDPWGDVLAGCSGGPSWVAADLRKSRLAEVRRAIPCLGHRRIGVR